MTQIKNYYEGRESDCGNYPPIPSNDIQEGEKEVKVAHAGHGTMGKTLEATGKRKYYVEPIGNTNSVPTYQLQKQIDMLNKRVDELTKLLTNK